MVNIMLMEDLGTEKDVHVCACVNMDIYLHIVQQDSSETGLHMLFKLDHLWTVRLHHDTRNRLMSCISLSLDHNTLSSVSLLLKVFYIEATV